MTQNTTTIDLLRHGQLATAGLFCAGAEEALSKEGLRALSEATKERTWDVVISSPYQRCRIFAEQLADQQGYTLEINKAFKEMDFGSWTGISTETLWQTKSKQLQQLWQSPETFVAPQGESILAFVERVEQGLQGVLEAHKNQSILLITHAGVIRSILAKALDISLLSTQKFTINYASLSRLHYYADGNVSLQFHGVGNTL